MASEVKARVGAGPVGCPCPWCLLAPPGNCRLRGDAHFTDEGVEVQGTGLDPLRGKLGTHVLPLICAESTSYRKWPLLETVGWGAFVECGGYSLLSPKIFILFDPWPCMKNRAHMSLVTVYGNHGNSDLFFEGVIFFLMWKFLSCIFQESLSRKQKTCPASRVSCYGTVTERTRGVPAPLEYWDMARGLPGGGGTCSYTEPSLGSLGSFSAVPPPQSFLSLKPDSPNLQLLPELASLLLSPPVYELFPLLRMLLLCFWSLVAFSPSLGSQAQ